MSADQTPLDVEAIRAELAAMAGRPWTAEAAEYFIGRLLDENARLNAALAARDTRIEALSEALAAKNSELDKVIQGSLDAGAEWATKIGAVRAELDRVIREAAADKARLDAIDALHVPRPRLAPVTTEHPGHCENCGETWPCSTKRVRDAAPEMPRPPAEEAAWSDADRVCAFDGCGESCRHDEENPVPPAQKPVSGPETAGTGSGRGTGVTEAPGAAQDGEEA